MASEFGDITATKVTVANAAALLNEAMRKGEVDTALAGKAASVHTHVAAQVTDLAAAVQGIAGAMALNSDSVQLAYDGTAKTLKAHVRRVAGGYIFESVDGLYVSGVAPLDHTHSQLHDQLAVTASATVALALNGGQQNLSADVNIVPSGGLKIQSAIAPKGLAVDLGSAAHQAAPGNHTHALLHAAATGTNTNSIAVSVNGAGQVISATLRRKVSGLTGDQVPIQEDSNGVYVQTGVSGVAPGIHTHTNATAESDGFMAAADKRKLDEYLQLAQPEMSVGFARHDVLFKNSYVGGRHRWGQNMHVLSVTLTSMAPTFSGPVVLALEVGGVAVETVTIPQGAANAEVTNAKDFTSIYVAAGEYARWKCVSGVAPGTDDMSQAPAVVDVSMIVRAALDSIPILRINCGGALSGLFAADGYYTGGTTGSTATVPDTSAVTTPAPAAVYQAWRQQTGSTSPVLYTLTGLGKGVNYKVRLHFCEGLYNSIGDQIFDIDVVGATTGTQLNFDILAQTSGVKFKAYIREFTLKADADGKIVVKLTPRAGSGGNYRCSINGIEVIAA